MSGNVSEAIYTASTWIIPLLLAITLHEAAHGFAARRFGDDTAWALGRVTLNPLKHVDPFGTVILPAILLLARSPFLFGYAKPVPVNFGALAQSEKGHDLGGAGGAGDEHRACHCLGASALRRAARAAARRELDRRITSPTAS